ncbi:MAG: PD-(D/E)XK nuclease family protein [Planctomycetota bacterium]|nr:PD-(D/E)XK nuclease family protein [Planctomycetota bacterium]
MSPAPTQIFLSDPRAIVDLTTEWLLENRLEKLGQISITLPGRRAARALEERLVRCAPAGTPMPTLHTLGSLTDAMVQLPQESASSLVRTLAWTCALQDLSADALQPLVPTAPAKDDLAGWMSLAQWLKRLHGELAAECKDFSYVVGSGHLPSAEESRWKALSQVQKLYREILLRLELGDSHEARLVAARNACKPWPEEVLLVGMVEMNGLQKEILRASQANYTTLIFSEEAKKDSFDAWGCLIKGKWGASEIRVDVSEEQWVISDKPEHQADDTITAMARWKGAYAPEEITVGILDDDVTPYLQRRLLNHKVPSHASQGILAGQTRPLRLLEALADWADGHRYRDLTSLLRHPDLTALMNAEKAPEILDQFHNQHLPERIQGDLPGKEGDRKELEEWLVEIEKLFGLESTDRRQPASAWVGPLLQGLVQVYENQEWNPNVPQEHRLIEAFQLIQRAALAIEELPPSLADALPMTFAQTIRLLLKEISAESIQDRAKEEAIEFVGWLELRLDPAKAVVITGFNEGKVPESVHADPFLPDELRKQLGLPDNQSRLARDIYSLKALLHEKESVTFISGRRSSENDPLLPSRLLFLAEEKDIAKKMRQFLEHSVDLATEESSKVATHNELPKREGVEGLTTYRVTDFGRYQYSPYGFYLERILGLKTVEDTAQEMDALLFGIVVHDILENFGKSQWKDSMDTEEIFRFLKKDLQKEMGLRFGSSPLPAVHLQEAQMLGRLQRFSELQAKHREEGWEIHAVEWKPEGRSMEMTFEDQTIQLSGRIDRVDKRVDQHGKTQFLLLDFKSGDQPKLAKSAFTARGEAWRDLQLPLYRMMGQSLFGDALLGYWNLPKNPDEAGLSLGDDSWYTPWSTEEGEISAMKIAESSAANLIRRIESFDFFEEGDQPRNPIFAGIAGVGLFGPEDEAETEEDGA